MLFILLTFRNNGFNRQNGEGSRKYFPKNNFGCGFDVTIEIAGNGNHNSESHECQKLKKNEVGDDIIKKEVDKRIKVRLKEKKVAAMRG